MWGTPGAGSVVFLSTRGLYSPALLVHLRCVILMDGLCFSLSCFGEYLVMYVDTGAGPAPGWDNLHVGAVSRHRLDSLNSSNDLLK